MREVTTFQNSANKISSFLDNNFKQIHFSEINLLLNLQSRHFATNFINEVFFSVPIYILKYIPPKLRQLERKIIPVSKKLKFLKRY